MQGMFIFTAMKTIKLSLKISSKSHKICYKGFFLLVKFMHCEIFSDFTYKMVIKYFLMISLN